jgi:AcrR family transcriptional regulator
MARRRAARGETKRHLLDRALTLFAEKGYAATSVREIIEAAGVTRPVLYYYCENKEDLFRRVVCATHEDAYRGLAELLATPGASADRLRAIIRGSFEFCAKDPRRPRIIYQAFYAPPAESAGRLVADHVGWRFGIIAQVMREGLASGELAGGDAESLALVFCSLMDQHIMVLSQLPHPEWRLTRELADALLDVFLNAVGTGESHSVRLPPFAAGPLPEALE